MAPKVLIVLTSVDKIPGTDHQTGWFLPEFAHAYYVLKEKAETVIASPDGGEAPLDPTSVKMFENDPACMKFLNESQSLWKTTRKLSDVLAEAAGFDAIFYVGGHGHPNSLSLIQHFANAKKPVTAVCQGPTVFLKATSPTGESLLSSATVTGFSNAEEDQIGMTAAMPFLLEDELNRVSGGKYVKASEPWARRWLFHSAPDWEGR
ncbi:hypothetical protein SI65_00720 [Aspergillus cristatus]|uniref:D-lactate dehydratase n=1 Tax=Aspergillus cristatus TaxID=573508 RepID=A0A1E3BQS4_ASPCR|nr:hypothetical protein SI65_00720 [Aspergillus cristatus]